MGTTRGTGSWGGDTTAPSPFTVPAALAPGAGGTSSAPAGLWSTLPAPRGCRHPNSAPTAPPSPSGAPPSCSAISVGRGPGGAGEGSRGPCGGARARPCRERPPRAPAPRGAPGAPGPARAPRLSPRPRAPRDADALQQHPARAGAGGDTRTAGTEGWRALWGDKDPEVTGAPGQGGALKQERRWGPWGDGDMDKEGPWDDGDTGGEGPKGDGDFRT